MNHSQTGGTSYHNSKHFGDNVGRDKHVHVHQAPLPEIDLNKALALLQALPTEVVPNAAPDQLPAGSRFNRLQQAYFVGRNQELVQIARTLKQGNTCLITTGIGGAGKSSLASEFAYRYGSYFAGGVFWLSFADLQNIANEIADCGTKLRLFHEQEDLTLEQRVERVKNEWQKPIPRLLIFDNCDQLSAKQCRSFLSEYLPTVGGCRVLITSRNSLWPRDLDRLQILALDTLERAESIKLLQHYRADLSDGDADAIAEELGDLPLALTLAGRFLEQNTTNLFGKPHVYLENLRKQKIQHWSLEKGEQSIRVAFDLSYQRLNPEDKIDSITISILAYASHFAPNYVINEKILFSTLGISLEEDEEQTLIYLGALQRLLELGLLQQNEQKQIYLHRLIGYYSQLTVSNQSIQLEVENTLINLALNSIDNGEQLLIKALLPHLYFCFQTLGSEAQDLRTASLSMVIGRCEHRSANYQQAEVLIKEALLLRQKELDPTHLSLARGFNNLAEVYDSQARYAEAEPLYLKAIAIQEERLGRDHPDTATSLNNLADLYIRQGKIQEAQQLYQYVISIRRQKLGLNHPDTAHSLNCLGLLYYSINRYTEAESLLIQALEIMKTYSHSKNLNTANILNNLGLIYYARGKYEQAEPLFIQALNIFEEILGGIHPDIASTINNLAALYDVLLRSDEAENLYLRALNISELIFGESHPDIANTLNNLAALYYSQSEYKKAESLYLRAIKIMEEVLEPNHPHLIVISRNLQQTRVALSY